MKKILLTVVCAVLMSTPAMAQTAAPVAAPQHERGQGMTKAQFLAKAQERAEKMFDRMDANKDGKVTREEMMAVRGQMKGERGEHGGRFRDKFGGGKPQDGGGANDANESNIFP